MPNLLEQAARKAARALKSAEDAKARDRKAREHAIAERKAKAAIRRERAKILGSIIDDAHLAGDLTPQELAVIGGILGRCTDHPTNWNLMTAYLPGPQPNLDIAEAAE